MVKVFVTVGTTKFDDLIKVVDSFEFGQALLAKGFEHLVVQYGNTSLNFVELLTGDKEKTTEALTSNLVVEAFDFLPSVKDHMESSSLIICHAGAGSIFEGLRAGKNMIVVPNAALMDNHQVELAEHLQELGHLVSTSPSGLIKSLLDMNQLEARKPFQKGSPQDVVERINQVVFGV